MRLYTEIVNISFKKEANFVHSEKSNASIISNKETEPVYMGLTSNEFPLINYQRNYLFSRNTFSKFFNTAHVKHFSPAYYDFQVELLDN